MDEERYPAGIRIVDRVDGLPGVDTLEGVIGPVIRGEASQAHFIDMPPGMFCGEHPHATESLVYTVRGRWVLASDGKRFVMRQGSIFWFGANVSTGYETPFAESALLLIFKGQLSNQSDDEFVEYLRGMKCRLEKRHDEGEPFLISELPADHPCRAFARSIVAPHG